MGINFFTTGNVKGYIKDNETGHNRILNKRATQFLLEAKGHEAIFVARSIFAASSKHEDTPPVLYPESFKLRHYRRGLINAIKVVNDDRTAEWVEFGAHAGGTTPVLKYRIFGRTFDSLEVF